MTNARPEPAELVERALAFVAEFQGDARCALNCRHAEALAAEVLRLRAGLHLGWYRCRNARCQRAERNPLMLGTCGSCGQNVGWEFIAPMSDPTVSFTNDDLAAIDQALLASGNISFSLRGKALAKLAGTDQIAAQAAGQKQG